MKNIEKVVAVVILFCVGAILVYFKMTPVGGFVSMIRDAIFGLGVFHASLTNPKE